MQHNFVYNYIVALQLAHHRNHWNLDVVHSFQNEDHIYSQNGHACSQEGHTYLHKDQICSQVSGPHTLTRGPYIFTGGPFMVIRGPYIFNRGPYMVIRGPYIFTLHKMTTHFHKRSTLYTCSQNLIFKLNCTQEELFLDKNTMLKKTYRLYHLNEYNQYHLQV